MYGYVVPDKSKIKQEEFALFSSFYCGICKALGRSFGQLSRYTTNYDITFFAILMFDQLKTEVEFASERCVGNPLRKKAVIKANSSLNKIIDLNIIFLYYKLSDNIVDGEGGGKIARLLFKKPYQKARAREGELDKITARHYQRLADAERRGETCLDAAADCFACLLRDCGAVLLGKNADDNALGLIYNVGKFVYLADALDDIGDDHKKKRYNPFLASLGGYKSRTQFIADNKNSLQFTFATTVNRAIECFNAMRFNQSYGLLENIVYYGLRQKTQELLSSKRKLKRPRI